MPQSGKPYFFISYAHSDNQIVDRVLHDLENAGIKIWTDKLLRPGVSWENEIRDALMDATGVIVFLSRDSTQSEYVFAEIAMAQMRGGLIIPVLLEQDIEIPLRLLSIQNLDMSDDAGYDASVKLLINRLRESLKQNLTQGTGLEKKEIQSIAKEARNRVAHGGTVLDIEQPPESVFVVHGHDIELRDDVEEYLESIGVKPIVLSKMDNQHNSLFEKFRVWSKETRFAVILITADDVGAGRFQYDESEVGERSLQFRARQNVILELGFFYGSLGWDRVFVLSKKGDKIFPNFERPSDLGGVLFEEVDDTQQWQLYLRERLDKAGFVLK